MKKKMSMCDKVIITLFVFSFHYFYSKDQSSYTFELFMYTQFLASSTFMTRRRKKLLHTSLPFTAHTNRFHTFKKQFFEL